MNEEQMLVELARLARRETIPAIDVSAGVVARIQAAPPGADWPLAVLAGVAGVAAAMVLAYAGQAWSSWQEPFTGLLLSLNTVLT